MAFSMHSHSGQFCPGHAKDNLEEIIGTAISKGMQTFALTEHMPRNSDLDLYPEEVYLLLLNHAFSFIIDNLQVESGDSISLLLPRHEQFITTALTMRTKYASQIKILIGFEGEWIRPSYGPLIKELASNPAVDFFIGSVHHVHGIPIDYDRSFYDKARSKAGGTDERLFEDYFDSQHEMLLALQPKVVGHFDLIRLLSDVKDGDLREMKDVWEKVVRNLKVVVGYGGLMEVNTSGLRKGLKEPYPMRCVVEEYLKLGGRLTLSDDSHGIAQVGTNYGKVIQYLETLGVEDLWTLDGKVDGVRTETRSVSLKDVKGSFRGEN